MRSRLRRTVFTRVMGGAWFQWLLTLQLAFFAWALAAAPGAGTGRVALAVGVMVLSLVLWTYGLTAWAEVDEAGLRWRYFVPVQLGWEQISRIELESRSTPGVIGPSQRVIRVSPPQGASRLVAPAFSAGRRDLTEFARAIVAAAHRHGVPVVGAGGQRWRDVPPPA